jgi:hypothetical protein
VSACGRADQTLEILSRVIDFEESKESKKLHVKRGLDDHVSRSIPEILLLY